MEHTSTTGTGNDCPIVYTINIIIIIRPNIIMSITIVGVQSLTGTLPSTSCKRTLEDRGVSSSTLPICHNKYRL